METLIGLTSILLLVIVESQIEKLVQVGTSLSLPCKKEDSRISYFWLKDGQKVADENGINDYGSYLNLELIDEFKNDFNLMIKKAKSDNIGNYMCMSPSTTTRLIYDVKLKTGAKITNIITSPLKPTEYSTVYINCTAEGLPTPTIEWFMIDSNHREPLGVYGHVLKVMNISRWCESQYMCRAYNELNKHQQAEKSINVTVYYKPDIFIDTFTSCHCLDDKKPFLTLSSSSSQNRIPVRDAKNTALMVSISANPLDDTSVKITNRSNEIAFVTNGEVTNSETVNISFCHPIYKYEKRFCLLFKNNAQLFGYYNVTVENEVGSTTIDFEIVQSF